jgi:hypothetical protein
MAYSWIMSISGTLSTESSSLAQESVFVQSSRPGWGGSGGRMEVESRSAEGIAIGVDSSVELVECG